MFENPFADPKYGFDHCVDCSIECKIYTDYYEKFHNIHGIDLKNKVKELLEYMAYLTKRTLFESGHGYLFPWKFNRNVNKQTALLEFYNNTIKYTQGKNLQNNK